MNCSNCGNPLTNEDKFCPSCGTPVPAVNNQAAPAPMIEELDAPNAQPANNMMNNNVAPVMNNTPNMQQPMNNNMMNNNMMNNNMMNNNPQPMNNNQNNKKTSIGPLYIIVGIIAVVIIIAVIVESRSKEPGSVGEGGGEATPVSNTSTYNIEYQGFSFSLPDTYAYEFQDGELLIGEANGDWVAGISVGDVVYSQLKANKDQLVSNLKVKGFVVNNVAINTYGGLEFITLESGKGGVKFIGAYTKLDAAHSAAIITYNEANEYDYDNLTKLAPIFKSAKYISGSNSISSKPDLSGILDFE